MGFSPTSPTINRALILSYLAAFKEQGGRPIISDHYPAARLLHRLAVN